MLTLFFSVHVFRRQGGTLQKLLQHVPFHNVFAFKVCNDYAFASQSVGANEFTGNEHGVLLVRQGKEDIETIFEDKASRAVFDDNLHRRHGDVYDRAVGVEGAAVAF